MSQPQAPDQDALSPEQLAALGQFNQMVATLAKQLKKMRDASQYSLAASKGPLAFAQDKLAEIAGIRAQLEKQQGKPEYVYASQSLTIMARMFEGSKQMMEVQNQYDQKNLALAQQGLAMMEAAGDDSNAWLKLQEGGLLDAYKFTLPLEDVRYLEARAQTNYHFALHYWMSCVDAIDAILRATVNDTAIAVQSPKEEAGRAAMAEHLRQQMAADRELAVMLGQWGVELQEAYAFFQWAAPLLKGLAGKSAEAKKAVLLDPDWQKLNGKAIFLANLIPKAQAYPELAKLLPEPQAPELPFEQLEWHDAPKAPPTGTGRLGGTGRLPGGTGRLQGGTGRLSQ